MIRRDKLHTWGTWFRWADRPHCDGCEGQFHVVISATNRKPPSAGVSQSPTAVGRVSESHQPICLEYEIISHTGTSKVNGGMRYCRCWESHSFPINVGRQTFFARIDAPPRERAVAERGANPGNLRFYEYKALTNRKHYRTVYLILSSLLNNASY